MTESVRLFVDEHPVEVPTGSTVLDAVEAFSTELALSVRCGAAHVTDGVGRSRDISRQISRGEILRVVKAAKR